jgi:hypothetical protein
MPLFAKKHRASRVKATLGVSGEKQHTSYIRKPNMELRSGGIIVGEVLIMDIKDV